MDQIRLRIGDRLGGACPDVAPWFQLARRVRIVSQGAVVAFDQKSLAISGRDIMKAGVPQGPLVGRVLARLLDRVIDDPALNVPESLLGLLPEIIEEEST